MFDSLDSPGKAFFPTSADHQLGAAALAQGLQAAFHELLAFVLEETLVVINPGNIDIGHQVQIILHFVSSRREPGRAGAKEDIAPDSGGRKAGEIL